MAARQGRFFSGGNKITEFTYKTIFCIFVVIDMAASLRAVSGFSEAMIFSMLVPNMIGLILLLPEVKSELQRNRK